MSDVDFSKLRRALVIKLRHHGDVLLSSPVLSVLKAAAPGCEVDALVYADTAPMLAGHPALSALHVIDRAWKRLGPLAQARAELGLLRALRARNYDLVIHLTEHRRGAWLARLLGPCWSVAPRQKGRGRFWRGSFSHFYSQPGNALRHTVERNLDALRVLGLHPEPAARRLTMVPGAEAGARVDALLRDAGLAAGGFIHLHPASRWLFKCWPAESMAALADALHQRGHALVLSAAPDPRERELVAAIRARSQAPLVDFSGQLSLRELAALTARARLFVGVDSAPMHIAAAVGTPAVALFGPSGDKEWGPWMTPHRVVASALHPCRPCGLDGCGGGKVSDCLVTLPVARVLAACEELLTS
ncbi:putative lipopolysaccharide heptosyltransferase III [Denitratisoma sp. DHT3]|uniref:putative lipopolysaccharide heptosyltransferase III n=1 Tax=Denitratisoma sp. DHT3 TaxID=1981880 RepID=UPI0011987844|nr:putative lipopolysaccharide heptosyltransferase III [Denitratisoma sp. DHT3]QDX81589.1 putative lipopolysaccharide heptosyltransferase III [Denitratisoma sp. DHT3]